MRGAGCGRAGPVLVALALGGCSSTPPPSPDSTSTSTTTSETATATGAAGATVVPTADQVCGSSAPVESAAWVQLPEGPALEVVPSEELRACGGPWREPADPPAGWASVLELVPDAGSPGLQEQYACHLQLAAGKEVWQLEPWRPVVGWEELVGSACNPRP